MAGVTQRGLDLVTKWEGFSAVPYNDPTGYCTIGIGKLLHYENCTRRDYDRWGRISLREGQKMLKRDIDRFYAVAVERAVKVDINDNERDALISLCYNIGAAALANSTVIERLNRGDRKGAARAFMMWVRGGGRVLPGLVNRRRDEVRLFLKPAKDDLRFLQESERKHIDKLYYHRRIAAKKSKASRARKAASRRWARWHAARLRGRADYLGRAIRKSKRAHRVERYRIITRALANWPHRSLRERGAAK